MNKILKYSFYDLMRSRWAFIYTGFYLVLTISLLALSGSSEKVVISLMNVILVLVPLIATIFGVMYYYHSREFAELLLAQPVRRSAIFLGQYLGIALSLSLSLAVGIGLPLLAWGIPGSSEQGQFIVLLTVGILLSVIFSALAYLIALRHENRIKGFGLAILAWLFFAVIYDGIFLLALSLFNEYPLENAAMGATLFNPIDLSRVLILLELDISALMGYTGAVFRKFLGTGIGISLALMTLLLWVALPSWGIWQIAERKDF